MFYANSPSSPLHLASRMLESHTCNEMQKERLTLKPKILIIADENLNIQKANQKKGLNDYYQD